MRKSSVIDVAIVGAGPVGLLLANYLGAQGLEVRVFEQLDALIDFPRGVGMDDECLRAIQAAGLVEQVLPHTTPFQWMRFVNGGGRCFASIEPRTEEFGWPRRNAFIQPLVDKELHQGLARYPNVQVSFASRVASFVQDADGVTLTVHDVQGDKSVETVRARYMVGADGGRSPTRVALGIPFEGRTDANNWIVVDVANDPVGTPNSYMMANPRRPHVSIALPHGVRRFEFMLFKGEAEDGEVPPHLLKSMLSMVVPDPERVELIRARVYTHNARLAARFREGRVLLAGDAAHIMPVWQGQGYNSGVRDAFNLGWKLAMVLKGEAEDSLLDTYGQERRDHAGAMINLSEMSGRIFSPTNPAVAALRDVTTWLLNYLPAAKRYVMEMRFKPMPKYEQGALHHGGAACVGRIFPQPLVDLVDRSGVRLDEVLGPGFAVLSWGVDPLRWIDETQKARLARLGFRFILAVPSTQLEWESERNAGVAVVGDRGGALKAWFSERPESVVVIRPDRFVGAACRPQGLAQTLTALLRALRTSQPAEA